MGKVIVGEHCLNTSHTRPRVLRCDRVSFGIADLK